MKRIILWGSLLLVAVVAMLCVFVTFEQGGAPATTATAVKTKKPSGNQAASGVVEISAAEACAVRPEDLTPAKRMHPQVAAGEIRIEVISPDKGIAVRDFLKKSGGEVVSEPSADGSFRARVSDALLAALSRREDVRYLEPFAGSRFYNDTAVFCTDTIACQNVYGLDGSGEVVAIADSGLDAGDLNTLTKDLKGRVDKLWSVLPNYPSLADFTGHGTHVAGTVAGSGVNSNGRFRGVAYRSRIQMQTIQDFKEFDKNLQVITNSMLKGAYESGARIHSNSWGDNLNGAYDVRSRSVDAFVWDYPEMFVVIAVGNDGPGAQTVGSPATAKNVLGVGNARSYRCDNVGEVDESSARGPCKDGRIKPDVVAPGENIVSVRSSVSGSNPFGVSWGNDYTQMSGTSMATPHVSGCAALVRQWIKRQCGYTNETAALMKAMMVTMTDVRNDGVPDNTNGWGGVQLQSHLYPRDGRSLILRDRLETTGSDLVFDVTVTNTSLFRATLVWLDPPKYSSKEDPQELVNDLDLVLSNRVTGAVYYGNGGTLPDRTNTLERVSIGDLAKGNYSVIVHPYRITVPFGHGRIALALSGAFTNGASRIYTTADGSVSYPITCPSVERVTFETDSLIDEGITSMGDGHNHLLRFEYPYRKGASVRVVAPVMDFEEVNALAGGKHEFSCAACYTSGKMKRLSTVTNGVVQYVDLKLDSDVRLNWEWDEDAAFRRCRVISRVKDNSPDCCVFRQGPAGYVFETVTSESWEDPGTRFSIDVPDSFPYGDTFVADAHDYDGKLTYPNLRMKLSGVFCKTLGAEEPGRVADITYPGNFEVTMSRDVDIIAEYVPMTNRTCFAFDNGKEFVFDYPLWWFDRYFTDYCDERGDDENMVAEVLREDADPDGDGIPNRLEALRNTDPLVSDPAPGKWYTIRFNANGGSGFMEDAFCDFNRVQVLPGNEFQPPAGKHVFKGWKDIRNNRLFEDKMLIFNLSTTKGASVEMKAVWE